MGVFVSWSGGKDSCLALHRAMKSGLRVDFLFTMLSEDGSKSRGHGLSKELLDAQARAIRIPIVYGEASWQTYEEEFKKIIRIQKRRGVQGGVFGDINLQEHRDWLERVCSETGIDIFLPLWKEEYEKLLNEFLGNGFVAVIVSAKADLIDAKWMGCPLDWEFVRYLRSKSLDLCGEKGEYHTLVTCGPIFKQRLRIVEFNKTLKNDQWVPDKLIFDAV